MKKIISYSLFKGPDPLAEIFYVRGLYFNVLMNYIVYPEWKTFVHADRYIFDKYQDLFTHIIANYHAKVAIYDAEFTHCQKMLWRMDPIFDNDVEYVICRDADALTSKREADAVNRFVSSDAVIHGISDNKAHSIPLMGGMCGFKCDSIREKYGSFENMIAKAKRPIAGHGTDQHFLNDIIYNDFRGSYLYHGQSREYVEGGQIQLGYNLGNRSHGSDLCTSFIGAAGCNEMETLRFLRSHLPGWGSDAELWKQYPKIFYWHMEEKKGPSSGARDEDQYEIKTL